MKALLLAIVLCSIGHSAAMAQWRKIADLKAYNWYYHDTLSEIPTCVYFIDLPGPARIGFAGTDAGLWKTIDGGRNWNKLIINGSGFVKDICFKDSLTGWFVTLTGGATLGSTCYRTTDGGNTWNWDSIGGVSGDAISVYYLQRNNRLFLGMENGLLVSTDLGDTWETFPTNGIAVGDFSFSDSLNGIAAAYPPYDTAIDSLGLLRTADGGITWDTVNSGFPCQAPLAIPGTPICFGTTWGRTIVYRSEDYGRTWTKLKDFGPFEDSQFNLIAPVCTGVIRGSLSSLYIQTDSGIYISTDQGITWRNDSGPSYLDGGVYEKFYVGKGIIVAGMTLDTGWDGPFDNSEHGGGLWEEVLPGSGVAQPKIIPSENISIYPNPTPGPVTISGAAADDRLSVVVTNVLGERVAGTAVREPGSGNVELDLSRLPAGTYFARVETADGVVMRKIIKQ